MVVPQLLVGTSPTALTIQVDGDRQYVPGEIAELAEQIQGHLSPHLRQALLSCDTRLDLMSATPAERTVTDREIIVVAQTDMDPAQPEVEKVILSLSAITSGYILDCVNNRFRVPGGPEWMQL